MIYFCMLVSNNTSLNILLPNDNKALKEVLKEADSKSLDQMLKNNSTSVKDVIKELFDGLKSGTKSNATIENVLKNSTVFKEMGNVSSNLSTLMDDISQDENLQKFKPQIESFLKNIKDMDASTLKEQISKSGVFLESKMTQTPNAKIENILNQIQNLVKNVDTTQAKQVNELLTKTFQSSNTTELSSNLKTLTSSLQNLSNTLNTSQTQNLSTLTNQLKEFISNGALLESKVENNTANLNPQNKETITAQTKDLLTQIKNDLIQNPSSINKDTLSQVQNLVKNMDMPEAKQINEVIAKIIQNPSSSDTSSNLRTLTSSLENLTNSLSTSQTQNKEAINAQTKDLLTQIKNELVQNPSIASKNTLTLIDNLLKMDNLFVKGENIQNILNQNNISTFSNNFSSNLSPLLTNLKESLETLNPNSTTVQTHISKLVENVENLIKDLAYPKAQSSNISDDMKSILLQIQDEVSSKTDPKSQDLARQVDKLLTQIDYHQLASITSNSNNVYLPFFWEMLDEGNISMKKTDEDKFYCQINLTLKDFGKVDLMLAMYDKNKIDLTIYAQREHFKTAIRDNMQSLKVALNSVDLIPVNIKLLDLKEEQVEKKDPAQTYMENSYSQTISSSIDIRA
ncbi:flagellar hook-length control protein FliK [Arcobacter acticola]|uniref:Flagellar hook-length control protein FliK n=1 Tax=Arcobacter acticola TaxID=1849015 RepID=A0A6M8EKA6_9BACT|nr:flagellar hook-length control protein FliK [Arcobacter acticola]QKE28519.1 flagellar hook-length control protein FliK [Arcobacter acticola]